MNHIRQWLAQTLPNISYELAPASADASFRRYFRVVFPTKDALPPAPGHASLIVMDAPPEHENCAPWLDIARLFAGAGVHVPEILAENVEQGLLLMSDLGSTTYLDKLRAPECTPTAAAHLYADAIGALLAIQAASRPGVLPEYSGELLRRELMLFPEWYIARHKNISLDADEEAALMDVFDKIIAVNLSEPQVFVHRDYHSRNLMYIADGLNPGIIDFQDAVYGPITYDLASLLKDAYIEWEEDFTLDLLARYWETARKHGLPVRADFADFHRDYEWMGVQRHIKVIGIFARLAHRDGKDGYLTSMPLLLRCLRKACGRYCELTPLLKLLNKLDPEATGHGYTF
ncbi:MAG: phosphotransferase [Azoarcus sp.]|jgi:aminoglycoside/choline kinase family phosphotransferase|nr:phosphotransferase [Azoarcus sp.]